MLKNGLIAAAVFASASTVLPATAQDATSVQAVYDVCAEVVASEKRDGIERHPLRGQCIGATGSFLQYLVGSNLTVEVLGATVAELVVELTELLWEEDCVLESEVAEAIRMSSTYAIDEDQEAQILLVYEAVRNCEVTTTAAVFDLGPDDDLEFFDSLSDSSPN